MSQRRALRFSSLDDVMPEVDHLLSQGHQTVGKWSLGQICNHVATALRVSIEGTSFKAPWLLRKTIAPRAKKRLFETGEMPEGIKLPEEALPKPGLDARAEAEALRASLRLYAAHAGPMADHPFFGPMTRDEWTRLHAIHCAHHLSFVLPDDGCEMTEVG